MPLAFSIFHANVASLRPWALIMEPRSSLGVHEAVLAVKDAIVTWPGGCS